MRVAVVGATGNTGTAVLTALLDRREVTEVLGIARRMPDVTVAPYSDCEWTSVDIAAASSEEQALEELREAFRDVDAVVHLAWLIQPNTHRELLRRVNVDGTMRVARAAADAGVSHLVVASSWAAYSPDSSEDRRDESWPVGGIASSHYSVDKAAQEQVLDEFAAAHPEVLVTRLRPALVFQADAAHQIQRYFLGRWIPMQTLGALAPPVLPVPKGLRGVQAVTAEDLAAAYASAVVNRVPGAFNICADDILGPRELADIVDHGRFVELPPRLVRAFVFGAHKARLLAADEGWLDMALSVPRMDNAAAKRELGWTPRTSAADALRILLSGMIAGSGTASVPLRPRDPDTGHLSTVEEPVAVGAAARRGGPNVSDTVSVDLLNLYLSDHLTGATAGVERIERMAAEYVDTPVFATLSQIAEEIRLERSFLRNLIHDLGMKQMPYRQALSWVGERLGRLKSNGRVVERSPMSLVLEAELMRSAVMGKRGGWLTLETNAELLGLDPQVFGDLAERALAQADALEDVHAYARARAFRNDRETFTPQTPDHARDQAAEEHSEESAMTENPEGTGPDADDVETVPETAPEREAERPGTTADRKAHDDALADEWGDESFPSSDPPGHY
ncbi:nucleoside-diphosphate-sugar epimerase [Brevibacterium sanguinis]|uniref:Nucleoside-diphosphate-sugar epimerase n=2 Tax=Brevibacterium TaxID=1696 RepID=A0A366IJ76_9MICO|nr:MULTISPECIES: NAD-dependent epimerase/dehydratase family protein [Brevibacterium]RBP63679.1 nucleoside-diphosphate-sugar epimerase [Brevibacterium sanguinis]RBP70338.1 nucleoside-diphosphate-sugar epimerase [Brevibacterium celere]